MYFLIPFFVFLAADQLVKLIVRANMVEGQSIPVIETIFHITYIENPGAAFGILANQRMLFLVMTAFIVGIMLYLYFSLGNKKSLTAVSLGIVVSGAVGNFIDRFIQGTVTDFLDFRIWPIFNIADICICVGLALICYLVIIKGEDL